MLLIIGFLFMVFIFAVISVLTGAYTLFIDVPSALVIIVSLIFFCLVSKSGKILGNYIKTSFKKEHIYMSTELAALSSALKNTIKFVFWVGWFVFLAGVIAALRYLDSKDMIGPNLAVALMTVIYAITVNGFVFLPVQSWAENKINTLKEDAFEK